MRTCIGLYGVSGVGKSTLCRQLPHVPVFEGAETIAQVCGSLEAFKGLSAKEKHAARERATKLQLAESLANGLMLVVGHYLFSSSHHGGGGHEGGFETVFTEADAALFTDVFYLQAPASVITEKQQISWKT